MASLTVLLLVLAADPELPSLGATMTPGMARTPPPEPAPPPGPDLHAGGNYVHLSVGAGLTPIADASAGAIGWGLAGGRYFVAGERFAGAAGGFGEHVPIWLGAGPPLHDVRFGAELRLGGRTRRLFAYGIGRLGTILNFNEDTYEYDPATMTEKVVHHDVYPWLFGSLGAGVQRLYGKRWLIGGEQLFDIGGEAWFMLRLRLILGVRF